MRNTNTPIKLFEGIYQKAKLNETEKHYAIYYRMFRGREGRITNYVKELSTEKAIDNFIERIQDDPNFYEIVSISYPNEGNINSKREND